MLRGMQLTHDVIFAKLMFDLQRRGYALSVSRSLCEEQEEQKACALKETLHLRIYHCKLAVIICFVELSTQDLYSIIIL